MGEDQNRPDWLTPLVVVLLAGSFWLLVGLLVALDQVEWGTAAAWITGIAAAVLAGLAWTESQKATRFAEMAVDAQDRATRVIEASMRVRLIAYLALVGSNSDQPLIVLRNDDSSVRIWLHRLKSTIGRFTAADNTFLGQDVEPHVLFEGVQPEVLEPGEQYAQGDPYGALHKNGPLDPDSTMYLVATVSITIDSETRDIGMLVDLSRITS